MAEERPSNDPPPTDSEATSLGLDQNIERSLTYVLGWVPGIVFLLLEKENKFIRFRAMQSIAIFLPLTILWLFMPGILGWLVLIAAFIAGVVLAVKAAQGETYKVPLGGDLVEKQFNK